jgi:predicted ATPase/DNA-binding winged helix-turn-helix (wHTH) protein/Tfp pilus assembly protein PilF
MSESLRFGRAEARPRERQLLIDGVPAPIGARAFDVLMALIERRGCLVSKGELLDLVWPGLVVEENNLQVQISTLRRLLGPQVIATIAGRGYRFTAALDQEPASDPRPERTGDPMSAATRQPAPDAPGPGAAGSLGATGLPAREARLALPAERDAFVGRGDTLRELRERFNPGARLVSLLGIGGCGKTRLAIHFGWSWMRDLPGSVWFCDLAPARTFEGVLNAVALGLDVTLGKDDPVAQLGHAIAGRGVCLVILDNFEQVARHAEATLGRWLERAADARFLVTSREVLGIAGEEAVALGPLPPDDAETLFMRRAASARRDFEPTPEERAAIPPLVRLLDGLPLAIELAAARVRTLTPRALLARMSERFRLLASSGGRLDRQSTLRAAFDWSWDLLAPADKTALAQLSVFEGGFTLEAVEAVVDLTAIADAPWAVDVVQSLVDKSFVRPCGEERFDLLVSVQAYAAEHLQTEGRYPGSGPGALVAAQRRHGEWFAALGPKRAVENGCVELNNLVAACRRNVAAGDAAAAVGALDGAWAALSRRGPFKAGVDLAEAVCAMPALQGAAAAHARAVLGAALVDSGMEATAAGHFDLALSHARAAGDLRCVASVTVRRASLLAHAGRTGEARAEHSRALELAREARDVDLECAALNELGNLGFGLGQMDEAQVHYEAALALARRSGDRRWQGSLLGNLGNLYAGIGRMELARSRYEESLRIARELGHHQLEGNTLCNLGMLHYVQRSLDEASSASEAALTVARELGYARLECIVLCNLGLVHDAAGRLAQAQSAYADALVVARHIGDRRTEGQVLGYLGLTHARQRALAQARQCLDLGHTLLVQAADRLSIGVLLCSRAECEWLAGDAAAARGARSGAAALAAQAGAGPDSELGTALARVDAMLGEVTA